MFRDKARGEVRELGAVAEEFPSLREGEALLFQLANGIQQLKRLVDGLGTAKDTVPFRYEGRPGLVHAGACMPTRPQEKPVPVRGWGWGAKGLWMRAAAPRRLGVAAATLPLHCLVDRQRITDQNARIQGLAKQVQEKLKQLGADRASMSEAQAAKTRKLMQDFAAMLQVRRNDTAIMFKSSGHHALGTRFDV